MGYTALPHRMRLGDQATSWFRGPLTPYDTRTGRPAGAAAAPFLRDADAAVALDPAYGDAGRERSRGLAAGPPPHARRTRYGPGPGRPIGSPWRAPAIAAHLAKQPQASVADALAITGLTAAAGRPSSGPTPLHALAAGLVAAATLLLPRLVVPAAAMAAGPGARRRGRRPDSGVRRCPGAARRSQRLGTGPRRYTHPPGGGSSGLADPGDAQRHPPRLAGTRPRIPATRSIRFFHLDLDWVFGVDRRHLCGGPVEQRPGGPRRGWDERPARPGDAAGGRISEAPAASCSGPPPWVCGQRWSSTPTSTPPPRRRTPRSSATLTSLAPGPDLLFSLAKGTLERVDPSMNPPRACISASAPRTIRKSPCATLSVARPARRPP